MARWTGARRLAEMSPKSVSYTHLDVYKRQQKELADQVGVTRQTIVAIEKAQYSPSLEVAFRIARVFDAPLEEVFIYSPEEDQALAKRARRSGATQAGQENQGS